MNTIAASLSDAVLAVALFLMGPVPFVDRCPSCERCSRPAPLLSFPHRNVVHVQPS